MFTSNHFSVGLVMVKLFIITINDKYTNVIFFLFDHQIEVTMIFTMRLASFSDNKVFIVVQEA